MVSDKVSRPGFPLCPHMAFFSGCAHVERELSSVSSSLIRTFYIKTNPVGLAPSLRLHLTLITFIKTLSLNTVTLRSGLQHMNFGEDTNQSITVPTFSVLPSVITEEMSLLPTKDNRLQCAPDPTLITLFRTSLTYSSLLSFA